MTTMQAVTFVGPHQIRVEDVARPAALDSSDALVQIDLTAICGTDLHPYEGRMPVEPGVIMGHEFVGTIVEVGSAVSRFEPGDQVSGSCVVNCGFCRVCRRGEPGRCPGMRVYGLGVSFGDLPGVQAQYAVAPIADVSLRKITSADKLEDLLFVGDIITTGYEAVRRSYRPGDSVAIVGAGPVGLCAAMSAQALGAATVMVIDRVPARLAEAARRAFTLQVVAETALTNMAFVALPDVGARNGDFTMPTTYMSVQSDEARHISNGYATLLTVLQDERNADLIVEDLQAAWWINHTYLDPFVGVVMDYFTKDRSDKESYLDRWDRWIRDDWYRSYIVKLGKLGIDIPADMFDKARERIVKGFHHNNAAFGFASWPLHIFRFDALDERDYEWFENKYPGWYAQYGDLFDAHRELRHPSERALLLGAFLAEAPPLCWTCQLPCTIDEHMTYRVFGGDHTRFYCSSECQHLDESHPGRYVGDRHWFDRYDGWELSEVVRDMGFVRSDGKTVLSQPHLDDDPESMWTLDDLRRCEVTVTSPNRVAAESLGLPSGLSPWASDAKRQTNAELADETMARSGFTGKPGTMLGVDPDPRRA